jgi:hypothetical protein
LKSGKEYDSEEDTEYETFKKNKKLERLMARISTIVQII